VLARHEMWLCGIKFLELDYEIFPVESETNPLKREKGGSDGR
jgi:hypothetical protein